MTKNQYRALMLTLGQIEANTRAVARIQLNEDDINLIKGEYTATKYLLAEALEELHDKVKEEAKNDN